MRARGAALWVGRRWRLWSSIILVGLLVNACVQADPFALYVLAGASMGCTLAVILPGYLATVHVVRHSLSPARAIEAAAARRAVGKAERAAQLTTYERRVRALVRAPDWIPPEVEAARREQQGGGSTR